MYQIRYLILLFTCYSCLYAGWNEDFDAISKNLRNEHPTLQNDAYIQQYENFKKIRKSLLHDKKLINQIKNKQPGKKIRINKPNLNIIVKKRRNNHIHELYSWELSYLLGSNAYVVPSFPVDIDGTRVMIQKLEKFETGTMDGGGYRKSTLDKVSLETYWKAHLQAYILGLADLTCGNIGVTHEGVIRFFDTEASFSYYNIPFKTDLSFSTGFICQSLDWAQYRKPLDHQTVEKLREFVQNIAHLEDNLKIYLKYRTFGLSEDGLQFRLNKVRTFNFEEGTTFRDFIAWIFPKMSPGLDELNQVVGGILKRKVDHGSSLFFVCRYKKNYTLAPEVELILKNWIKTYIE